MKVLVGEQTINERERNGKLAAWSYQFLNLLIFSVFITVLLQQQQVIHFLLLQKAVFYLAKTEESHRHQDHIVVRIGTLLLSYSHK